MSSTSIYTVIVVWDFDHSRTEIRKVHFRLSVECDPGEKASHDCDGYGPSMEIFDAEPVRIERYTQPAGESFPSQYVGEVQSLDIIWLYRLWFDLRHKLEEDFARDVRIMAAQQIEWRIARG